MSNFPGPEGQRRVASRTGLRLGATSQHNHLSTLHFAVELHWFSLSQMPSSVHVSPKVSSGLLYLSLLNTDNKMVDETRGLVTLVPRDTRCRQYMCNFSTCTWPKHCHTQHLENRVTLIFFFFLRNASNTTNTNHLRTLTLFQAPSQDHKIHCQRTPAL